MYHYVYLIQHHPTGKKYIGCRSSNTIPQEDLGKQYFSSSTDGDFRKAQKDYPEQFEYVILDTTQTREEALSIEVKYHKMFDVAINENFYNRAKQTSTGFSTAGKRGYERTPEHKRLMSERLSGRKFTESHKRNISKNHRDCSGKNNPMYGVHRFGEQNPMYGKTHTDETRRKMKGPKKRTICEFCGMDISVNRLKYHQDSKRCKKFNKTLKIKQ